VSAKTKPRVFHCRQEGCPNIYTEIIGGDTAFGKHPKGDCVPCFMAAQMLSNGQIPELIETSPEIMDLLSHILKKSGWAWSDVKASFERKPVVM
jgi:hypothetical protein